MEEFVLLKKILQEREFVLLKKILQKKESVLLKKILQKKRHIKNMNEYKVKYHYWDTKIIYTLCTC